MPAPQEHDVTTTTLPPPIAFIDLKAQRDRIGVKIDAAIAQVLAHGQFIMGPEVATLETQLANYCGAKHAITCASGTDALALVLMARKVRPGQAILVPSFTFCATAEVVAWLGAVPVFVDCNPATFNMDPASLVRGIATARHLGLNPVGVIPVDLFGLPADYPAILDIAAREKLFVLADAAQGFGGAINGKRAGSFGLATATSFFPAKPLGCYGDGGAVFTDDDDLAALIRSLRVHGQGTDKYDNVRVGMTARLDTVQAAILIEKLAIFEDEIQARGRVAARYTAGLGDICATPVVGTGFRSAYAQYTITVAPSRRHALVTALKQRGIPTNIYYPRPLHHQTAYRHYPIADGGLPISEALASEVLSLPMHPYLSPLDQDRVIEALRFLVAQS